MPRKKTNPPVEAANQIESTATAVAEPPAAVEPAHAAEPAADPMPAEAKGKNYGPSYKSIFSSAEKGFELGENRRYCQRVFMFKDKPAQDVIDRLKEHGFKYRPAEKAWTVEATAESRLLTDRLARELAGNQPTVGRG